MSGQDGDVGKSGPPNSDVLACSPAHATGCSGSKPMALAPRGIALARTLHCQAEGEGHLFKPCLHAAPDVVATSRLEGGSVAHAAPPAATEGSQPVAPCRTLPGQKMLDQHVCNAAVLLMGIWFGAAAVAAGGGGGRAEVAEGAGLKRAHWPRGDGEVSTIIPRAGSHMTRGVQGRSTGCRGYRTKCTLVHARCSNAAYQCVQPAL
ncbi:hypothetical protein HaLaN_29100 [Haematococcus lacustris]|uniref:Uncharacterized protein n=1 Tax=Haematococcus lacustris TaxID=44745 RepID=A0A6A0ABN6_HAELA|nr:hypothetical protein HaLaN_29100 [Haematococcus lacustris]